MNISTSDISNGLIAALGGFFAFFVIIVIAVVVVQIVASVKVFQKAGVDGWKAIIPYYNTWVKCEIAGVVWWFFLLVLATSITSVLGLVALAPLAGLVSLFGSFAVNYNLAIKFGKDPIGYGIGLTLLPVVFYSILAFGDAKYNDAEVSTYGPIPESKVAEVKEKHETKANQTTTEKKTAKAKFCKNCGAELDGGKYCSNCGSENTQK